METPCLRICICYVLTTLMLTGFIYLILSMGVQNARSIERLREDMDDIAHLLHQPSDGSIGNGCAPKEASPKCGGAFENREINMLVDTAIKRKLGYVMDDIYNLKKQLGGQGYNFCSRKSSNTDSASVSSISKHKSVNYASEELGARIVDVDAEPVTDSNFIRSIIGLEFISNAPVMVLRPSLAPGSCFAYKGSKASITIRLAKEIFVESIAITHIARELTPTLCTDTAPKTFTVFGLNDTHRVPLGLFTYDNSPKKRTQEFHMKAKFKFTMLQIIFSSNHGNPNYTCIYTINVYGRLD